jgi:putative transposase
VDELFKDVDPKRVFVSEGLMAELKKALPERMLTLEIDHHLDQCASAESDRNDHSNHRNVNRKKSVRTNNRAMDLEVPWDRSDTFEPQLFPKFVLKNSGF